MNVRLLDRGEMSIAEPLIRAFPYKPYRNYRVYPRKVQDAVMLAEVASTLDHADGIVVVADAGDGQAGAIGRRLEWDSRFFNVSMGRIEYLLGSDPRLMTAALTQALDTLRVRGVQHVTARADVADIAAVGVLESNGFRLMDSLVTYTTRPHKEPPNPVREVGTIRPFHADDAPELLRITEDAYQGFRGRYHLDPHVPPDRAEAFYPEWARQCMGSSMADMILVSEGSGGQLLGYLAFRRREPVSSVTGTPVFGGGLGACRRDTPGAYAGLIRAGTIWAHAHDGVAECQTQNYNFSTVRIYEAVGAHYVRGEYTLHAWLGRE